MRKAVAAGVLAAGLVLGSAGGAWAGGMSEVAQIHPGHKGYITSEMKGGGVPAFHFHNGVPYPTGPGGWGGAVSSAAQEFGGLPNAHTE